MIRRLRTPQNLRHAMGATSVNHTALLADTVQCKLQIRYKYEYIRS